MKTTTRLNWEYLTMTYATMVAKDATTATENLYAYLDAAIEADAQELHAGDTNIVLRAFKNNCVFDKRSRLKKALNEGAYVANVAVKRALLHELEAYCDAHIVVKHAAVKIHVPGNVDKWSMTTDQIDTIPVDDYAALDSVYQCMATKKAKYPEHIEASMGMAEFKIRYAYVSKLRSAAKANRDHPVVSDELLTKLQAGKKTLTKAELEQLLNVLTKQA